MQINIKKNLKTIRERVAAAAERAGRKVTDIKLVAVTKTHPPELVRLAINAGASALGENKVQEAESKIPDIGRDAAEWHLIGHLQSNKARKAVQLFDVIHSVDSVEIASRLERICVEEGRAALPVFVQVDIAREETKSGIIEPQLPVLVEFLKRTERLKFNGLMVLPPFFENPEEARPFFKRLRDVRDRLADEGIFDQGRGELSMGMSHDFEIAIEEGATIIRVGTAIFGERE